MGTSSSMCTAVLNSTVQVVVPSSDVLIIGIGTNIRESDYN